MTPDEIKAQARAALDTVADAMAAFYDGDHEWFRKCIEAIKANDQQTHFALQAMMAALVHTGVRPRTFRDIPVEVIEVDLSEPEQG